jgi:hypothetical protein
MNIAPFLAPEVFGPREIKAMSTALDEVCGKVGITGHNQAEREKFSRTASSPLREAANAIPRCFAMACCETLP